MAVIKLTQVIQAPVADVFRTVVDLANFPRWNPTTHAHEDSHKERPVREQNSSWKSKGLARYCKNRRNLDQTDKSG